MKTKSKAPQLVYGRVERQQAEAFAVIWKTHFGVDLPIKKAGEYLAVALAADVVFRRSARLKRKGAKGNL